MSEFFNYDALTGITEYIEHDPFDPGKITITQVQDIEPALEMAKMSRDNSLRDPGIKENWFHYAIIPALYQVKLRKLGLDLSKSDDVDRAIKHINTHWPKLKMTTKNEGGKKKAIYT